MVDIKSHRILDMIESREYEPVKDWLSTYKNLQIISRDGSVTYRNAITDSHPDIVQVSDRFHLIKNLTSYATDYLKKELKSHVCIGLKNQEDSEESKNLEISKENQNRKLTLNEKYELVMKFIAKGKKKTWICKELNMDIRSYDRVIGMTPAEREHAFNTNQDLKHNEIVNKKMQLITEIRNLKKLGLSNREISRRTGTSRKTISKYLDPNFNPVHSSYGKK